MKENYNRKFIKKNINIKKVLKSCINKKIIKIYKNFIIYISLYIFIYLLISY